VHVTSPMGAPVLFISDIYIPSTSGILAGSTKDLDDGLVALKLNVPNLNIVGGHGNVDAMGNHFVVPYPMFKTQLTAVMPAP